MDDPNEAPSSGLPPQVFAALVVACVGSGALALAWFAGGPPGEGPREREAPAASADHEGDGGEGATAAEPAGPSPFAGLAPEAEDDEPFRRRRRRMPGESGAGVPYSMEGHPDWARARALAAEAAEIGVSAQSAREAGDRATFTSLGLQAASRYDSAVGVLAPFVARYRAELSAGDLQLRALLDLERGWKARAGYFRAPLGGP